MSWICTLTIPFPPSVNCLYKNNAGRGKRPHSDRYKKWLTEARPFALSRTFSGGRGGGLIVEPVTAWYRHGQPDLSRRRDVENYAKAISDILKEEKILEDDSLVHRMIGEWADDVQEGYTEVVIAPLAELGVSLSDFLKNTL